MLLFMINLIFKIFKLLFFLNKKNLWNIIAYSMFQQWNTSYFNTVTKYSYNNNNKIISIIHQKNKAILIKFVLKYRKNQLENSVKKNKNISEK